MAGITMATMITSECINCGACEPECPNTAIYQGGVEWQAMDGGMHPALSDQVFYIVPEKCTECVGFHDHEACAAVCPVDCCVPNPDIPETHDVLLVRARTLHPETAIPDDAPSRFKKEGGDAASTGDTPAAPVAAPVAAAVAPAARPAAARGKVEKAKAKPKVTRIARVYPGELALEFEAITTALGAPRRRQAGVLQRLVLAAIGALQGIYGAASGATLRRFEEVVSDHRFFRAEFAVAANVFLNVVLYPIVCGAGAIALGRAGLFTADMRWWVVLGFLLAFGEAAWRLRDNFFRGVPLTEARLRGACYGPLVLPLIALTTALLGRRGEANAVGFDGFSAGEGRYDEKLERARRYGDVFKLEERDDAYVLRVEFPRRVPPTSLGTQLGLPTEMPDYDFELTLQDGTFVVQAKVIDPDVRKLTGVAPAFPGEFTTRVALRDRVTGFRHRYQDKTLEVILPKAVA
jgi:ferredoxin